MWHISSQSGDEKDEKIEVLYIIVCEVLKCAKGNHRTDQESQTYAYSLFHDVHYGYERKYSQ
jgi:hypothetical protein